jgi:hypothetical protein
MKKGKGVSAKEFLLQLKVMVVAAFIIFMIALLTSCATYNTKPKIQITHVLAVTEQGDTLRLPINMIKPNVYYNIISYPDRYYGGWYNNYYQPHYSNYKPIYVPSKGSNGSSNNNNNNNNKIVPRDNPDKRPSGEVLLKGKK